MTKTKKAKSSYQAREIAMDLQFAGFKTTIKKDKKKGYVVVGKK